MEKIPTGGPEGPENREGIEREITSQEEQLTNYLVAYNEAVETVDAQLDETKEYDGPTFSQIQEAYKKAKAKINALGASGLITSVIGIAGSVALGEHGKEIGNFGQMIGQYDEIARHIAEGSIVLAAATAAIWAISHGLNKYSKNSKEDKLYERTKHA